MAKQDNDNGKRFHITLNAYDQRALEFVRNARGKASAVAAMRVCVRAAALQLGFTGAMDDSQEIFSK